MDYTIHIPSDLEVYFNDVVKTVFSGDAEAAILEGILRLVEKERREMVDDARLDGAIEKIRDRHFRKEEIADQEMNDAFRKLAEKKKRAAQWFAQSFKKPDEPST